VIIYVPLAQIDDNPFQRRQDYGDVESLAADIRARGLLQIPRGRLLFEGQPVDRDRLAKTLEAANGYPGGESFRVQLAFGHRRLRAFRHLDTIGEIVSRWSVMPVYVEALTDDQMLDAVWSENQHRSDINPIEQAELLAEKLERARAAGGNQTTVAAEWGLDRSTVANKILLLDLPADVQTALRERKLSERQALALLPVVEMEAKLNGTAVNWNKSGKVEQWGTPAAPAIFMRHVVANPDKTTSDAIREYARRALDHAGLPLPDDIATFDTGSEQAAPIIQPLCAGCRYRHNQHCLEKPCLEAKWEMFRAQIPRLAAEHTGLPWSGDWACFPNDRDLATHLRHLYGSGQREGLVVGLTSHAWRQDWLDKSDGFRSARQIQADWRKGLIIGLAGQSDEAEDDDALPAEPPLGTWRTMRYDAKQARKERVKQAFVDACAPLAEQNAFRPLLALASADDLADFIGRLWPPYLSDRNELAARLQRAGLDPILVDPTDPADRLHEMAVDALADWYDYRDSTSARIATAAVALGEALDAFVLAGITEESEATDLADLLRWLTIARADAVAVVNGGD
jgi:ParB/RepB/Spo0J family partition protein